MLENTKKAMKEDLGRPGHSDAGKHQESNERSEYE